MAEGSPFHGILVIGVGLIGGSLAASTKRLHPEMLVLGVDEDAEALAEAVRCGVIDEGASPEQARQKGWLSPRSGADLAVLAVPARAMAPWLALLAEERYRGLVTDVASTKAGVTSAAAGYPDLQFVGGHPMAGSERSGVGAARADLFDGAYYVLTPDVGTDMDAFQRLHAFVTSLGARVISIEAAEHDSAVAAISHVPHVAAAALVALAARRADAGQDALRLAAGGFKDMTRIAAGSPELWTGICLDNADAVTSGLDELCVLLTEFAQVVRTGERDEIRAWLADAAEVRQALPARWVPKTAALTELSVPVVDRPGMVGDITTAVSRAGCNIEDIEIDHTTEDTAVLRLVLTDEGDLEGLLKDLADRGYESSAQPLRGEA